MFRQVIAVVAVAFILLSASYSYAQSQTSGPTDAELGEYVNSVADSIASYIACFTYRPANEYVNVGIAQFVYQTRGFWAVTDFTWQAYPDHSMKAVENVRRHMDVLRVAVRTVHEANAETPASLYHQVWAMIRVILIGHSPPVKPTYCNRFSQ